MHKQIALFNHKGGVSKTTTAFNLGWKLAQKGKRVLLVDCDPQCNLTGMVFGYRGTDDLEKIYDASENSSIFSGLRPAFDAMPMEITAVDCVKVKGNKNLFLLPGHIGLSELEVTLGIAQDLSGSIVTLQNLPGSLRFLFDRTAEANNIEIVIVDMSPSLGAINQNLLVTSDYFLVPTAPDFFSGMAIKSLASIIPRWAAWASKAATQPALKNSTYPFKYCVPKYLGLIIQKYKIRKGNNPSVGFKEWISNISSDVSECLLPALKGCNLLLSDESYAENGAPTSDPILQMSDFNTLIARSQKFQLPVFSLKDEHLTTTGLALKNTKIAMQKFNQHFDECATKILGLIS